MPPCESSSQARKQRCRSAASVSSSAPTVVSQSSGFVTASMPVMKVFPHAPSQKHPEISGNNLNPMSMIVAGRKSLKRQDIFYPCPWQRVHASMFSQLKQGVIHEESMGSRMDARVHPCARRLAKKAL